MDGTLSFFFSFYSSDSEVQVDSTTNAAHPGQPSLNKNGRKYYLQPIWNNSIKKRKGIGWGGSSDIMNPCVLYSIHGAYHTDEGCNSFQCLIMCNKSKMKSHDIMYVVGEIF